MDDTSGEAAVAGEIELGDVLVVQVSEEKSYDYEIVGVFEDDEEHTYAVAYSAAADSEDEASELAFVVVDANGKVLEDDVLAQEVLDNFLIVAEESAPEES